MAKLFLKGFEQEKEKFEQSFPNLDYFCTKLLCDVYGYKLKENDYEFPKWLLGQSKLERRDTPQPYKSADDMREKINGALNTMNEREWAVIVLRYGLPCKDNAWAGKPKTLREIGKMFNLSTQRIGDIEKKAFKHLRHPARTAYFFKTTGEIQAEKEEALKQEAKNKEISIFGSGLPIRCENCLARAGFETIQDIIRKADFSSDEPFEFLNQVPNLGQRSIQTIINFLPPYIKAFQEKQKEFGEEREESTVDNRPPLEEMISAAAAITPSKTLSRPEINLSRPSGFER